MDLKTITIDSATPSTAAVKMLLSMPGIDVNRADNNGGHTALRVAKTEEIKALLRDKCAGELEGDCIIM